MQESASLRRPAIMAAAVLALLAPSAPAAQAGATTYLCVLDSEQQITVDTVKQTMSDGKHTVKTHRLKNGGIQWSAKGWGCTFDPKALTLFCEGDAGASEVKCTTPAPQ